MNKKEKRLAVATALHSASGVLAVVDSFKVSFICIHICGLLNRLVSHKCDASHTIDASHILLIVIEVRNWDMTSGNH